jgi:hypothetical protein
LPSRARRCSQTTATESPMTMRRTGIRTSLRLAPRPYVSSRTPSPGRRRCMPASHRAISRPARPH